MTVLVQSLADSTQTKHNQADLPFSSIMPPRAKPIDLKNVTKLFNDTIAAIRDDTPDVKALEPQAIEWLKAARNKLMRDLEQECVDLQVPSYSFLYEFQILHTRTLARNPDVAAGVGIGPRTGHFFAARAAAHRAERVWLRDP
jgi:hypothetical protein